MNPGELAAKIDRPLKVAILLLQRDGENCSICNTAMLFEQKHKNNSNYATIDHIMPKSMGGLNALKNLRLACHLCNTKRGNYYTPEMGGIGGAGKRHAPMTEMNCYYKCRSCGISYMVFGWQNKKEGDLCFFCEGKR